jgi:hypothetical protein
VPFISGTNEPLTPFGRQAWVSGELGGAVEFDCGGVAEGVEDAEHQVGGDESWKWETGKWKLGNRGRIGAWI